MTRDMENIYMDPSPQSQLRIYTGARSSNQRYQKTHEWDYSRNKSHGQINAKKVGIYF